MHASRLTAVASAALIFNALVYGLAWVPFRYLDARGLHGLWATVIVYLLCAAAVLLWRPGAAARALGNPFLWLLMAAAGITNASFNWGVVIGEVVRVVLLFYLMPVWAAVFARLLLGETIGTAAAARMALALTGAAIVLMPPDGGWPLPASLGDWLGVSGGIGFALTNVLIRRERQEPESVRLWAMFAGAVVVSGGLALALTGSTLVSTPPPPAPEWMLATVALAAAFLVGNLALIYGAGRLPANVTSILLLTEVVFAAGSAVWIGDETLDAARLIGGAMIMGAAAHAALNERAASG